MGLYAEVPAKCGDFWCLLLKRKSVIIVYYGAVLRER